MDITVGPEFMITETNACIEDMTFNINIYETSYFE